MTDKKEQTVVEHLVEFRRRLLWVVITFLVFFLISLTFAGEIYQGLTSRFSEKLIVLGPNDILWIYIRLGGVVAVALTLPVLVYQVWAFVRPALEVREARAIFIYIPASFLCFCLGIGFGFYFITPALLDVLLSLGQDLFATQLTAQNYLTFVLHTTLPMALLFELPVVVAFLTTIGLLNPNFLVKYRRYAYFVLLVIAVVVTPADFVSDLVMTAPLILLFELSLLLSHFIYHRKIKRRN